jgi:hypothetical protein
MKRESDEITLADILGPDRTTKKPGDLAGNTARAKELFLYGNGDGRPVRDIARLSEMSGAAPRTLERWTPVWKREAADLAKANSGGKRSLVASVTETELAWQAGKVATLKSECDRLEKLLPDLPAGSDIHRDTLKLLNATLAKWEESSGFSAYADTQAALAKEMVKTAARQRGNPDNSPPVRNASGFTFDTSPALPAGT